jgi:hypothetical protein
MDDKKFVKSPMILFVIVWMTLSTLAYVAVPEDSDYFWWIAYVFYLGAPTVMSVAIFYVSRFYGFKGVEGKVWTLLAIGLLLWTIGEWMWCYYSLILEIDPYPSAADYLYIAGYIPFILGLYYKAAESLVSVNNKKMGMILAGVVVASLMTGLFVVAPTMNAEDYGTVERSISITYPILDLVLLAFALAILAAFWDSKTGSKGWMLFSLGLIAMTAADIIFSAMDWQGIYYAQMDLLWIASYLLFLAGAVYQYTLHKSFMGE